MDKKMKKKEARGIAISYLFKAAYAFSEIESKYVIDDKGTLSESGYDEGDCNAIQKELDFLIKKIMQLDLNK